MKRQTQGTGVRNWYGGDILSLQEEPMKVLDGFFSQYGVFVLSGCEVTANGGKYDIAPGLVVLEGAGPENTAVKVVAPFAGLAATSLPVYLTLTYDVESDVYNDGKVKPIANSYKAVATSVKPAGSYVQISQGNILRFVDVVQDAAHRFVTDAERKSWTGKVDKIPGKGLSTNDYTNEDRQQVQGTVYYDYVVDSDVKLQDLRNNTEAINVLIKAGVWASSSEIGIHPNCRSITGEHGSKIVVTTPSGYGNESVPLSALYPIDSTAKIQLINVTAEIKSTGTAQGVAVFRKFTDMQGCTAIIGQSSSSNRYMFGYVDCDRVHNCKVSININRSSGNIGLVVWGFYRCENLNCCIADMKLQSTGVTGSHLLIGFRGCYFLSNCHSTVESISEKIEACGFMICKILNNCSGLAKGGGEYVKNAFKDCDNLVNCQGIIDEGVVSALTAAFYGCKNISNCIGRSSRSGTYGFTQCKYLSYCVANNAGYWSSVGGAGSADAADTQAGGWNRKV